MNIQDDYVFDENNAYLKKKREKTGVGKGGAEGTVRRSGDEDEYTYEYYDEEEEEPGYEEPMDAS